MKRVLILNEVGASSPGLRIIDNGIMAALQDSPYHIQFYIEYMDSVLFPDAADQQKFREFYIAKYTKQKPDVIVTVGPTPLQFMVEVHRQFFPGVPIVFCLRNGAQQSSPPLGPEFTGVEDTMAVAETLEAALRLVPNTEHVVVTGGVSAWDIRQEAVIREALRAYERRLDISYLTDLSLPDLLERVSHLPAHTIVLMATLTEDAVGNIYVSAAESGPMVAQASNVPVFSFFEPFLNHGIVGGDLSDFDKQGRAAGSATLRLLNGERPQEIPIVKDVTTYMFDWKALKRWGMNESNLPPNAIVINRQPTIWEAYTWYIVGAVSLIVVEALLIFTLLWHRTRLKATESELAISYDRFRMAIEGGRFVGWDFDINAETNQWFGDLEGMFGIRMDRYVAQKDEFRRRVHPDDIDSVVRAIDKARRNKDRYISEFRVRREDGSMHWVIARGQFYYSSDGTPKRMLGLALDITDRKLAEEALAGVSRRLIQAQEQERTRIARELHDDINQRLAMLQVELDQVHDNLPDPQSSSRERLMEIRKSLSETSNEVQAISHRLHSSKLEYLGLVTASRSFCKEVAERQKVRIEFNTDGVPAKLPQDVALNLFRVLQESLQNAIKYSSVQRFQVWLRGTSHEIQLTVRDNGIGFDVGAAITDKGLGLISMRERVSLVNGTLLISSKPKGGTEINVRIPLAVEEENGREDASELTPGVA